MAETNTSARIMPTYRKCPFCGERAFGVACVFANHYERQCAACGKPHWTQTPARYNLPSVAKKVIYLDQFVVSNMMKALNPAFADKKIDVFWWTLFERLDQLCKLQAIVCPWSVYHVYESFQTRDHAALIRMVHQLSAGVSFVGPDRIKAIQLRAYARAWATGANVDFRDLDVSLVTDRNVNAWRGKEIAVPYAVRTGKWVNQYAHIRDEIRAEHSAVFERWKTESGKRFQDWFEEECRGFVTGIQSVFERHVNRKAAGTDPETPDLLTAVLAAQQLLQEIGAPGRDTAWEFLSSPLLQEVPFIRITSAMYAAIAHRGAKQGKLRYPESDIRNDINVVAHLLPYCDAMFLDKECVGLLREQAVSEKVRYSAELFCCNQRSHLLAYLDTIRKSVSSSQVRAAVTVYGKEWLRPSVELYHPDRWLPFARQRKGLFNNPTALGVCI